MDRLFCMQVFVRVVEQGAFARAADALGISRASATSAVSKLEQRLGVRLLHRTTRRLSVTDDGRSFYADCVRILGEVAEAEDSVSSTRISPRGRLRISIPQSFISTVFFPALMDFMQSHPRLSIEAVLTDRAVNLVEEGIDCAIRGTEIPEDSGLVSRRLSQVHWVTCASPEYLETKGMPREIEDLARHECIRFISPSSGRPRDWIYERSGERVLFTPRGRLHVTSMDAAVSCAVAGGGIAQVPDALSYADVEAGRLRPILTPHVTRAPSLKLVYPGNRYLTAKVRTFADYIAGVFPPEGWWPVIQAAAAGQPVTAPAMRARK